MRHRPGLGIPASGLLPLAVVSFELTLGATACEGWGMRAVTQAPRRLRG